ncbi:DUF2924 domain-containing protein [Amaricoccus solimangrovi]|uniref:DUF2924 domain-containing protein n=1 Tax=Amaricoccus solimangrovi TaxID=2589815 RepID=A0A501WGC7_9RHOB|nr:DUF2924 domain-containing protein [Amaricoccus solimangrovi]TPE48943.1 DUF2924 domain-containing protein [Amaricoccus solimangrovi]
MRGVETGGGARSAPAPDMLDQRIAGLAGLPIGDLRAAWAEAWAAPPPKGARRRLLMLGIAWKWQAELEGGLPAQIERRLTALETAFRRGEPVDAAVGKSRDARRLMPGARLIRVWKDQRHEVVVTESGFRWSGRDWASLSAIARAITGGRRDGPAFFGLRDGTAT